MKKLFIVLAIVTLIAGVGVMEAEAANPATVGVTVTLTLAELSVSVTPALWEPIGVVAAVTSPTITATNNSSNRTEDLGIVCGNGTTIWTIGATAGNNIFAMTATGGLLTAASLNSSKVLQTGVVAGGTVPFTLTFTPPTSSAVASDSMTVTITAS